MMSWDRLCTGHRFPTPPAPITPQYRHAVCWGQSRHRPHFLLIPGRSFAEVYGLQGSDLGFAAGVMGIELTDSRGEFA